MSRIKDIISRFPQKELTDPIPTNLWPRFRKVRDAIAGAFTSNSMSGIKREQSTFNWSGEDAGIHDHTGNVEGTYNGIQLKIQLKGTTVDDNPEYVIGPNEEWYLTHQKKQDVNIWGEFISQDGRVGAIKMHMKNGEIYYEAYWLQTSNSSLLLEQIVNPKKLVFDANMIQPQKTTITIPGTNVDLKRSISSGEIQYALR
jgi:hypothetical protein